MKILFDQGVPKKLRLALGNHEVRTAYEAGLSDLENGALLCAAQGTFNVLITTDSNIKYQQRLPDFEIALLVLRAFSNALEAYLPLVPQILETLERMQPGEVIYLYADETLARIDARKGWTRY
jgi:hypothetical protein